MNETLVVVAGVALVGAAVLANKAASASESTSVVAPPGKTIKARRRVTPGKTLRGRPVRPAFDHYFDEVGRSFGVPPNLLRAIAWNESTFDPNAYSENLNKAKTAVASVDYGLMQINGANLRRMRLTPEDAYNPKKAIEIAATLLVDMKKSLTRRLGSGFSVYFWTMAYNTGPDLEPRDKGKVYADRVIGYYERLERGSFYA